MGIKSALRLRARDVFASAAVATLFTEFVENGQIYCLQFIAWEIDKLLSNGNSRARLYIDGHGYKHYLEEIEPVDNNTLYTYDKPLWLIPRERLALELDQVQASTTAEMDITGYSTEFKEGMQ